MSRYPRFHQVAPTVIKRRHLKAECVAALAQLYPLANLVIRIVFLVNGKSPENSKIKKSFEMEVDFLEVFSRFLVDEELGTVLEDPKFSTNYLSRIAGILNGLQGVFSSYKDLAARFGEHHSNATRTSAVESIRNQVYQDLNVDGKLLSSQLLRIS